MSSSSASSTAGEPALYDALGAPFPKSTKPSVGAAINKKASSVGKDKSDGSAAGDAGATTGAAVGKKEKSGSKAGSFSYESRPSNSEIHPLYFPQRVNNITLEVFYEYLEVQKMKKFLAGIPTSEVMKVEKEYELNGQEADFWRGWTEVSCEQMWIQNGCSSWKCW
jgi:hypothetical protein